MREERIPGQDEKGGGGSFPAEGTTAGELYPGCRPGKQLYHPAVGGEAG